MSFSNQKLKIKLSNGILLPTYVVGKAMCSNKHADSTRALVEPTSKHEVCCKVV